MRHPLLAAVLGALMTIAPTNLAAQSWVPPVQMADPGALGTRIESDGVLGNYFPAPGEGRKPAILLIGGSEGGLANGGMRMAQSLQDAGFNVLQISYYRAPGQPEAFSRIPLETFDRGIAWLAAREDVDPGRIAIVGASKGAEAALVMATRRADIRAVVAGMPSSVVWPAFSWDGTPVPGSSWTLDGQDLPSLPYGGFDPAGGMGSVYTSGLTAAAEHPDTAIRIEASSAPVLLVCGRADALWPSCPMAEMLQTRSQTVRVLAYDDAGHAVFGVPLAEGDEAISSLGALGGSPEGNNAARNDSWPQVIAFLREALTD